MLLDPAQGVHRHIGAARQLLLAEAQLLARLGQQAAETLRPLTLVFIGFRPTHGI